LFVLVLFLIYRLNKYLNNRIEPTVLDCIEQLENLRQAFKDVLVNETFLLDNSKLKKLPIEKEKDIIVNGNE